VERVLLVVIFLLLDDPLHLHVINEAVSARVLGHLVEEIALTTIPIVPTELLPLMLEVLVLVQAVETALIVQADVLPALAADELELQVLGWRLHLGSTHLHK